METIKIRDVVGDFTVAEMQVYTTNKHLFDFTNEKIKKELTYAIEGYNDFIGHLNFIRYELNVHNKYGMDKNRVIFSDTYKTLDEMINDFESGMTNEEETKDRCKSLASSF